MMKRIITVPIVLVVAPLLIVIAAPQTDPNVREIGSRLELFVDSWLIDTRKGVELRLHRPVLGNRVLEIDQPWEKTWEEVPESQRQEEIARGVWNGPTPFGFTSVMKDGDLFRMYYTWDRWNRDSLSAYAESRDGIHWTKPELGIVEFRGSKANNLFWSEEGIHNFNPFLDRNPAAGPEARYKALGGGHQEGQRGLIAFVSADALHWEKLRDKPVITDGAFDSQNVAFWDMEQRQYVAFYRDFVSSPNQKQKVRAIKRATSSDFISWSKGEWLNYGDAPLEQFYTNAITPYFRAPHLYIGFPMRIVFDRKKVAEHPYDGVSDAVFMSSRDGTNWDRQFLEGFVNPGLEHQNWTERNFLVTWGVVPTGPYEMSMYWVEHFRHPSIAVRRGTLRIDGFASLYAGYEGGEVITHPLTFQGRRLLLNYSTSAAGGVRVELQRPSGEPISGFSLDEALELYGDNLAEEYQWSSNADLGQWAGKPVRLRMLLKDAHLYSLRFQP